MVNFEQGIADWVKHTFKLRFLLKVQETLVPDNKLFRNKNQ